MEDKERFVQEVKKRVNEMDVETKDALASRKLMEDKFGKLEKNY